MMFAVLLSLRKKFPIWRIGRAQTWMRGHLWLGLLSYPLILFHSAFSMGNGLSRALMWIFSFVVASGLVGIGSILRARPQAVVSAAPRGGHAPVDPVTVTGVSLLRPGQPAEEGSGSDAKAKTRSKDGP